MRLRRLPAIAIVLSLLLPGCDQMPGKPVPAERWKPHTEIEDFSQLYSRNCSGCHGLNGRQGAAQPLNDPLYQALITDESLRGVIARGVPGTLMPSFAESAGGSLTSAQIEALLAGMRAEWARPSEFKNAELPPY